MDKIFDEIIRTNDSSLIYEQALNYYYGRDNLEIDYDLSIQLFEKALELGEVHAKYYIAESFYFGRGVKINYQKAFEMFCEVADKQNNAYAKSYLAIMYYYGKYVEKNYEKEYNIFCELIEQYDDKYSKYYIGLMYYNGNYVKKDYEKAYGIFEQLSINFDDDYAQYQLGEMYYNGEYVKKDENKAIDFWNKAIAKNNSMALRRLAKLYCSEEKKDYKKAIEYYKVLVQNYNEYEDKIELAEIYQKENYYDKALEILEKLLDTDTTGFIHYTIGEIYHIQKNDRRAVEFLEIAVSKGADVAKIILGEIYLDKKQDQHALEMYKTCLDSEIAIVRTWAKYVLGSIYYYGKEKGLDVEERKEEGLKLIKEAADENLKEAIKVLKEIKYAKN